MWVEQASGRHPGSSRDRRTRHRTPTPTGAISAALPVQLLIERADTRADVHALLRDQRLPVAHGLPEIVVHDP
jgi:hypothetical protein